MAGEAKRLGELLVEQGLLKSWQLDLALQSQRTTKAFLGKILVQKGWITEDTLLRTLAQQFGIAYVHLDMNTVDWAAAGKFSPAASSGRHHCVAVAADERTVTAAIANPLDAWVISELEQRAGSRTIRLVLAPVAEIHAALAQAQQWAARSALRHPGMEA
jgi:hypothetical protein